MAPAGGKVGDVYKHQDCRVKTCKMRSGMFTYFFSEIISYTKEDLKNYIKGKSTIEGYDKKTK